jgi:hypothetical protein
MGKLTLTVAVGACMLACGADWDEAIDEHASSSEGAPSEELPSESADDMETDDPCNQQDVDTSTSEAALGARARLRTSTPCTVQVTRRGKAVTIEYAIK